ncbi:fatty acyl-AMP ligase [Streptomyces sp. NPDC050738]|uniref:fatty acyl-AMP ligase n=1 Tax=Streptomyces sp. NPDC050738 TaxID=3154744 RepID=UPI00341B0BDD
MASHRTFAELMIERAAHDPDRVALLLLPDSDEHGRPHSVSYRSLDASARALAGWLQERGAVGGRVLLLHTSRSQFAVSFLACLYAGAIAVPAPPTGGRSHHAARIAGIVKDAAACAVLTDAALAPDVSRLLAECGQGGLPCLAADAHPGGGNWELPRLTEDSVAYLQYTSGSTGRPRGVMVTHGNLLANQEAIGALLSTGPDDRVGGWLPYHHDMGLVGQLLHPLWAGGTSVALSPAAFVRRPARWPEAVSRYGITVSGAPDFAYDLCARRTTPEQAAAMDLSGWRAAVIGGEPVRLDTARAFTERFAPAGLRPGTLFSCYGLAEATLLVSGARVPLTPEGEPHGLAVESAALERNVLKRYAPDAGRPSHDLLPLGSPAAPAAPAIRVVDPVSRSALPDGTIGEIWVRGPAVSPGYWRDRGHDGSVFGATTAQEETGYLRTGDLGTLEDGQLYVTGRIKEMIVVSGRNLYPQDLEQTLHEVSSLFGAGTAFAIPGERERVVVVQELRTHQRYALDLAELAQDVRRRLTEEFDVPVAGVLLVRPGTVRHTSSGKVERTEMRRLFLSGAIQPLYQHLEAEPARTGPREGSTV